MKNNLLFFAVTTLFLAFSSCKSETNVNVSADGKDSAGMENTIPPMEEGDGTSNENVSGTFIIEQPSNVNWIGSAPTKTHAGILDIKSGSFVLENGNIKSGSFEMDMTSIRNTDLKPEDGKQKLETHLKSADFFEVQKYPTATFTLKNAVKDPGADKSRYRIMGDLKIKDITKPVEFDAFVITSGDGSVITATTPNFEVNRTDYGIKYNSGMLNTAKDKLINDNVGLVINIRAKKS